MPAGAASREPPQGSSSPADDSRCRRCAVGPAQTRLLCEVRPLLVQEGVAVSEVACWEVFFGHFETRRSRSGDAQRSAGRCERREQQQEEQASDGSSTTHDGVVVPSASHDALLFSALNPDPAAVPGRARRLRGVTRKNGGKRPAQVVQASTNRSLFCAASERRETGRLGFYGPVPQPAREW